MSMFQIDAKNIMASWHKHIFHVSGFLVDVICWNINEPAISYDFY